MSGRERLEHHDKARYTVDSVEPVHRPIIHDSRPWCSLCENHCNDPTADMHEAREHPDTYSPPPEGTRWG